MSEFLTDIQVLRDRARANIENGPVTDAYKADLPRVIDVLQQALATELVCVLRYRQHHYAAKGLDSEPVAAEFLQHANEEQQHADLLATRIGQLGGTADFNPATLSLRAHSEYRTAESLMADAGGYPGHGGGARRGPALLHERPVIRRCVGGTDGGKSRLHR